MKYLLAVVLCTLMSLAHAQEEPAELKLDLYPEVWVNFGGVSKHLKDSHRFNENNSGIGIEVKTSEDITWIAGMYKNSEFRDTRYAGVAWQPLELGPVRLGLVGGVADGYPGVNRGGVFPIVLPVASTEYGRFGVNLLVIPPLREQPGVVVVQFKFKIK